MTPADNSTCSSDRRGPARSNAILEAAIELVAEVGYERMTMDAVATRAKASKATIYRHWPDKAALVVDAMRQRTCADDQVPNTGSLRGDLECFVRHAIAAITGVEGPLMVGLLAATARDPELAALMQDQVYSAKLEAVSELLSRARDRHEIDADVDPDLVCDVLPGAVFMRLLVLAHPPDEAFVHRLVDDILLPILTAKARQRA